MTRLEDETKTPPPADPVCQGTLISSRQYQGDVASGLIDARIHPRGRMTQADVDHWVGMLDKGQ
ncbi:MAG: hypothetical protein HYS05_03805 [Acidobacteria bacterium]|nr:hypothetical protein [Acidobacteriota bacterium]